MKVVFLLTAHAADDERVRHHQLPSLRARGAEVTVMAPRAGLDPDASDIIYHAKPSRARTVRHVASLLTPLHPDVVVGDTPMALRCALRYRREQRTDCCIIYDITEWYPSKKNVRNLSAVRKVLKFMAMSCLNAWTNLFTDGFIFGETYKARPFLRLFPHRPFVLTSYYPDLQFIDMQEPRTLESDLHLFYSGSLTEEKGFFRVVEAAKIVAARHPNMSVSLKVLSSDHLDAALDLPSNLRIEVSPYVPFRQFCHVAAEHDLFLDLRSTDIENQHCLPIKLFYYMAMGRPVIYSDLKAIRQGCPEIWQFGQLVNPYETNKVADCIDLYLRDDNLFQKHCATARKYAEQKYNWKAIENAFARFILQHE
ncbi:MAG: glycosyltransferase [Bacteroidales bacterium]|nr:glycosyltransferase [Bacteroidales bacterium]